MRPFYDERLYKWPKVMHSEGEEESYWMKFRYFSPLRYFLLKTLLYEPLKSAWKFMVILCVIDFVTLYGLGEGLFYMLPAERKPIYITLGVMLVLWIIESASSKGIGELLFGNALTLKISENAVQVTERFKKPYTIRSQYQLSFRIKKCEPAQSPIWKQSQILEIIIDQTSAFVITEIFPGGNAEFVVTNANLALSHVGHDSIDHLDRDPTRDHY